MSPSLIQYIGEMDTLEWKALPMQIVQVFLQIKDVLQGIKPF